MSSIVLQRFARVSMLGMDIEARTDLTDEPVIEADDLGKLLEYQQSRMCRRLVRRLIDDERLSCTAFHHGTPQNSADNSTFRETNPPTADVYSIEVIEPHGVRLGTTEQLWLTERACLLVATASETERAWQVRTALVDFFLEARRARLVHPETASIAASQRALDEARAIRADIVQQLELDKRVRMLEQRPFAVPSATAKLGVYIPDAAEIIKELAAALHAAGQTSIKAKDALRLRPALARFGASPRKLGMAFKGVQGIAVNGRFIESQRDRKDISLWSVRDHDPTRTD